MPRPRPSAPRTFVCLSFILLSLLLAALARPFAASSAPPVPRQSSSAPGSLDPSFGRGGKVDISGAQHPEKGWALALQPDGKILVGGPLNSSDEGTSPAFAVERRNPDGSPDASFGQNGVALTPISGFYDFVWSLAVAPDGKIVAAGQTHISNAPDVAFAVVRYHPDGAPDPTFDGDGVVVTNLSPSLDHAFAVMVQPDGRVVAAGFTTNGPNNGATYDFVVVRYNVDGSLDATFDGDGVAQTDFFGNGDIAWDALLQPDGRIVLAGYVFHPTNGYDFGLARYNPDGSLDQTFGAGGKVTTPFMQGNVEELARSITLAPGGKLVAGGWARDGTYTANTAPRADFAAARYHPDGSLDPTFDGDGRFVTNLSTCNVVSIGCDNDYAFAVVAQQDGKVILAGTADAPDVRQGNQHPDFTILRLNPDGSRDSSFGRGGVVSIDFADVLDPPDIVTHTGDEAHNVLIQPDGRILVSGELHVSRDRHDIGLARLLGDSGPVVPPAPVNVALAANGARVNASSTLDAGRAPLAAINGDRRGLHWGTDPATGSGWHDATNNSLPDWLEITFNGTKAISEVNVFSVQDNFNSPSEPGEAQTFTKYGVTGFTLEYWDAQAGAWAAVPGGTMNGNNKVWAKVTFAPLQTTKLRVVVSGALAGYSRITEVEAWGTPGTTPEPSPTPTPAPTPRVNVAAASQGATAAGSSTLDAGRAPLAAINGDRRGLHWGTDASTGSGWHDATNNSFPDWLEVTFDGAKTISEVHVFSVQDNFNSPSVPTAAMTFTKYGVAAFDVEYWTGAGWAAVPGGAVAGNNKVWFTLTFAPLTTTKIRILVKGGLAGYSRIVEVEAY